MIDVHVDSKINKKFPKNPDKRFEQEFDFSVIFS